MVQNNIEWRFNPPLASHQGGFYERYFRIVRKVLRSIVGEATLEEYDLLTLLTEVERILNNRPISETPSSPDEFAALTPSMVLTGVLDDGSPPGVFLKSDGYKRSWKKTQYLANQFWERWLREYLPLLQPRSKWFGSSTNFKKGDLVLIQDDQLKRGCWSKAVVEEMMPDAANLVRRVRIRTGDGRTFVRDVRKLSMLEGKLLDD